MYRHVPLIPGNIGDPGDIGSTDHGPQPPGTKVVFPVFDATWFRV